MKAKISFKVEILDGEDAGYILSEEGKVVEIKDLVDTEAYYGNLVPHQCTFQFILPSQFRNYKEG